MFGTVGISFGGLLSFYGTKLLPKSMWGSLEAIKSLHRNGGEWVWFMAMMCMYLGIQPNNDRPVRAMTMAAHRPCLPLFSIPFCLTFVTAHARASRPCFASA